MIFDQKETTSVRGMAILMIAIFHLFIAWEWPRVVNLPGSVGVAAFLFLSGYGINESYKKTGLKEYWRKKLRRVMIPFWLFVTILFFFKQTSNWHDYLLEVAFIKSDYWFIPYLVWCYLLYWIVQRFFSHWLILLFIVAGIIGLNLLYQIAAEQSFSFFAGVMASRNINKIRQMSERKLYQINGCLLTVGVIFLLIKEIPVVHNFRGTFIYNYLLLPIKLSLGILMTLLPTLWKWMTKSRFLYLCGISSLEIYLVHMALVNYTGTSWHDILTFIAITTTGTWLFYKLNQRIIKKWI